MRKVIFETISAEQQIDIEKAKKASPIGTEKEWGGKIYVKDVNGWKLKGKGKSKKEEVSNDKNTKQEEISGKKNTIPEAAKNASDTQLEAAIKDPKQKEEVKEIAKKELEERNSSKGKEVSREEKKEFVKEHLKNSGLGDEQIKAVFSVFDIEEAYNNLQENIKLKEEEKDSEIKVEEKIDKIREELTAHIDEKFKELSGFKKITQTYVKVDGQTIVLNMKGEDRYKAKKGSFYMESEKNEPLQDFKKKVKEEFTKQQGGVTVAEKEISIEKEPKKTVEGSKQEQIKAHKEKETVIEEEYRNEEIIEETKKEIERLLSKEGITYLSNEVKDLFVKNKSKINKKEREEIREKLNSLESEIQNNQKIKKNLDSYSEKELTSLKKIGKDFNGTEENKDIQIAYNSYLIEKGQQPYLTPFLYNHYKGKEYKIYDQSKLNTLKATIKARELCYSDIYTASEIKEMSYYTGTGYHETREFLTEKKENLSKFYSENKIKTLERKVKHLTNFINKSPIKEDIVLSRRINCYGNKDIFAYFQSLKPGDSYTEKSFTSFSLSQQNGFGDFQITCLAKKGQKFASVESYSKNPGESEFVGQKGQRYKVLEVGTNSIVIEVVD